MQPEWVTSNDVVEKSTLIYQPPMELDLFLRSNFNIKLEIRCNITQKYLCSMMGPRDTPVSSFILKLVCKNVVLVQNYLEPPFKNQFQEKYFPENTCVTS